MSHRAALKKQTTISPQDQPTPASALSQSQKRLEPDKVRALEANRHSATRDNTRSNSDQPSASIDLGSRWCPEEIEIFFTCKLPRVKHRPYFKFDYRISKIRLRVAEDTGRTPL